MAAIKMGATMDSMLFSGVFDLPWWGYIIVALLLTHITIVTVTVFLHRHQAHHALDCIRP